jgi:hypothetical protein
MAAKDRRSALTAEHEALKRQTQRLQQEHQQLQLRGATRAERRDHQRRLREKLIELEAHLGRLRRDAHERELQRMRAADEELERRRPL